MIHIRVYQLKREHYCNAMHVTSVLFGSEFITVHIHIPILFNNIVHNDTVDGDDSCLFNRIERFMKIVHYIKDGIYIYKAIFKGEGFNPLTPEFLLIFIIN